MSSIESFLFERLLEWLPFIMVFYFFVSLFRVPPRREGDLFEHIPWPVMFLLILVIRFIVRRMTEKEAPGLWDVADGMFMVLMLYTMIHDTVFEKFSDLHWKSIQIFQTIHAMIFVGTLILAYMLWPSLKNAFWVDVVVNHNHFLAQGVLVGAIVIGLQLSIFAMRWTKHTD